MDRKKVFYRYNPQTLSYERVYPSLKSRILIVIRHLLSGILIGGGGLIVMLYFFGSPSEIAKDKENKMLRAQIKLINKRLDQAFTILEPIQERDDYMYRAMFQAEPIARSIRTSGVGGLGRYQELEKISNPELIIETVKRMDVLDKQLYVQSNSLDEVLEMLRTQKDRIHHTPSIVPVADKDLSRVASGYGWRTHPIYRIAKHHDGMDFTAPTGTPVYATADGVVVVAKNYGSGYGKCIDIDHGYNYLTRYAHLHKINVKVGQKVTRGEIIGEVGNTGLSTGSHLHYEVRVRGEAKNPALFYHGDLTPEEFDMMLEVSSNRGNIMD